MTIKHNFFSFIDLESISIKDAAVHTWRFSQEKATDFWDSSRESLRNTKFEVNCSLITYAALGILLTLFSWTMVYLDSDVPGVNPPTPFSPRNNRTGYQQHVANSYSLGYLMTIVNGLALFVYLTCFRNN